jgi:hypothetical protein
MTRGGRDRVVEVSDQGNEIRDQVDGAYGVGDGLTKKPSSQSWSLGVSQGEVVDPNLAPEAIVSLLKHERVGERGRFPRRSDGCR